MNNGVLNLLSAAAVCAAAFAADQPEDWGDFKSDWADSDDYRRSQALCRSVRDREPPASDAPTPEQAAALRGCSSEALYYGIGMRADPVRARHCAFVEAREGSNGPFAGRTMLMTIYANARGARRDLDVAIHLACGVDGAPAESHGRVTHLVELRDQGRSGADFHFCDDVTSGLAAGYCADHQATIAGGRRSAELERISGRLTPPQRRAFAALRAAHDSYVEAHGEGEVDLSGTLRAAMQIGAQEALRDQLVEMLRRLESGRGSLVSAADYGPADAALNSAYRRAIRPLSEDPTAGMVTPEGIRNAQRAWLRYRDSFVAFAALRYPRVPRNAVAAWLTRQRVEILVSPDL